MIKSLTPTRFIAILLVVFGLTAETALGEFISLNVELQDVKTIDAEARTTILNGFIDKLLVKYKIGNNTGVWEQSARSQGCKL
jgi:hypothetical protein